MTDVYLLVDALDRELAPDTFSDITPATYEIVTDREATADLAGGQGLILRFDAELTPEQMDAIFQRARMGGVEATLRDKIRTAITANSNDIAQDQNLITQADALIATTGARTNTQLSNDVRSLAQGVKLMANNDIVTKRELTALVRLVGRFLDSLDGT